MAKQTKIEENKYEDEKYQRFLHLYEELKNEILSIQKEQQCLREEMQKSLDQHKTKQVLEKLVSQP